MSQYCARRQDLLQSLVTAMDRVLDLGAMEIVAATNGIGAGEIDQISRELHAALEFKRSLLDQFKAHVHVHCCGCGERVPIVEARKA